MWDFKKLDKLHSLRGVNEQGIFICMQSQKLHLKKHIYGNGTIGIMIGIATLNDLLARNNM